MTTSTRWEYKVLPLILTTRASKVRTMHSDVADEAFTDFEAALNTLGDVGWEVIGYYTVPLWSLPAEGVKVGNMPLTGVATAHDSQHLALLKRPKE